jgi:hypothetical protein
MGQALNSSWYPFPAVTEAAKMAESVLQYSPASDAEALKLLRASFPHCPLSLRVAALDLLMRRKPRHQARSYAQR